MNPEIQAVAGGAGAPRGFVCAGTAAGIKAGGDPDLAVVFSQHRETSAAGSFTTNRFCAAPVLLSRERAERGKLRAAVINSGAANAGTGREGMADAIRMGDLAGAALGVDPSEVAVCSTGTIGRRLPMGAIERGIRELGTLIEAGGNDQAARAIMTTDTRPKEAAVEFRVGSGRVRVGGMAKGAGMIEPRMTVIGARHATMLAFITTDARVEPGDLRLAWRGCLERSFNRITVDGDTSTNDTVLVFANGASGIHLSPDRAGWSHFLAALETVAHDLARMIAGDGEGATKLVRFDITGANSPGEALSAARSVADSLLLKCALFGEHPNWGRILAALGYSEAKFDPAQVKVDLNGLTVVKDGMLAGADPGQVSRALARRELNFVISLGPGRFSDYYETCDISPEYVEINKA